MKGVGCINRSRAQKKTQIRDQKRMSQILNNLMCAAFTSLSG